MGTVGPARPVQPHRPESPGRGAGLGMGIPLLFCSWSQGAGENKGTCLGEWWGTVLSPFALAKRGYGRCFQPWGLGLDWQRAVPRASLLLRSVTGQDLR